MHEDKQYWYAVYTKPRWEKKVHGLLLKKGIEAYCPLNKVKKKWSDRIKWVEEPLFKSYVFVRIREQEQGMVRMINGIVNFVYYLGRPATIKDKEITIIRKFLNDYEEVVAEPFELRKDARITINNGLLMNREAKVVNLINNKVRVIIESIGYSLVAVVNKSNISLTEKPR
jgi:transcription antitermination factor NusG